MRLKSLKVNITLPFIGLIEGTWEPNEDEKKASWELYIELITRISTVELKTDEGLLREALSSLYNIFPITREILKKYGTVVARPTKDNSITFGYLAVAILNLVLRPVLSKWHPLLLDYENQKPSSISILEHEKNWKYNEELRRILHDVQCTLNLYADLLAEVSEIPSLHIP